MSSQGCSVCFPLSVTDLDYEMMAQRINMKRVSRGFGWSSMLSIMFMVWVCSCMPEPLGISGLPVVQPQIVVSTQIVPDESLVVLLTKTFGALDADGDSDPAVLLNQIAVNDAVVTITGPQRTDTLLFLGLGFYGGLIIPFEAGQEYTLNVISETLGEVRATTTVKPQVLFKEIEASLYYNGFGDTLAEISYSLVDPVGANWYMLNVQEVEQEDITENVLNPRAYTRLVDDKNFDGNTYAEITRVFPRDYSEGDTIAVSLSNISEEYYTFIEKRIDNRYSFIEYLSEPVNYPTNVIGGKGYFNLYIPDVRVFTLE
jgi:hypothetical protein